MNEALKYYSDVCPDCESWDVRITSEDWNDAEGCWDIIVYCRQCGFEWPDFIEGDANAGDN